MAHVVDKALAVGRAERRIEDGEMLFFYVGRAFNGARGIDVVDDGVGLRLAVAQL